MEDLIVNNARWIHTTKILDGFDGTISVAEEHNAIPFNVKRVYYIYNLINHEKVVRGQHAHKTLHQVLFCINGSCTVQINDSYRDQEVELSDPAIGMYLGPLLWHTMRNFQNNCILLVVASDIFKEEDYIRDFSEFLRYCRSSTALL